MIKAHEIQGCIALENSFNRAGLDHVVLVKVATTAVVAQMLGLDRDAQLAAVSLAWVDGQSLRRSEEHTSELQSLMRISYAVFCLKKQKEIPKKISKYTQQNKD